MTPLAQGAAGQDTRNLQQALNYHLPEALPRLATDGRFGPRTEARLRQFQAQCRLQADGIVGPHTHRALYTFVRLSCHLLTCGRALQARRAGAGSQMPGAMQLPAQRGTVRMALPALPLPLPLPLPPLPRTPLPFPALMPPLPPLLQPPRLEIDPRLLELTRSTRFELEAGQQSTFRTSTNNQESGHELSLVADLKGIVWSRPLGKLELSAGPGIVVEQRLRGASGAEFSVYVFGKAEVSDVFKFGPLDIAKFEAEAQLAGKPGLGLPPDLTLTLSAGPEVKVLHDKLSFGPAGYFEFKSNGFEHQLTPGVKMTGTIHF